MYDPKIVSHKNLQYIVVKSCDVKLSPELGARINIGISSMKTTNK